MDLLAILFITGLSLVVFVYNPIAAIVLAIVLLVIYGSLTDPPGN